MPNLTLYFCQIVDDRWHENRENILNIHKFVDHLVIINGRGTETANGLKKIFGNDLHILKEGQKIPREKRKVYLLDFPWRDDFILSRNQYINIVNKIRESNEDSWFIVSDEDEFFSKRLCKRLRKLCEWADQKKYTLLKVRCRGIELDINNNVVNESIDNYWKDLIFKWKPGLSMSGQKVHHGFSKQYYPREVLNLPDNIKLGRDKEILYEHRKMGKNIIWERSQRNWFIYASNLGETNKLWKPFRELVDKCMEEDGTGKPKTYIDYMNYLKKGNIHQDLKDWMIRYSFEGIKDRDYNKYPKSIAEKYFEENIHPETRTKCGVEYPGSSEIRETFLYYFKTLHTEEKQ